MTVSLSKTRQDGATSSPSAARAIPVNFIFKDIDL
jgi:hypothetical protein